jgi:hypothetical protein
MNKFELGDIIINSHSEHFIITNLYEGYYHLIYLDNYTMDVSPALVVIIDSFFTLYSDILSDSFK